MSELTPKQEKFAQGVASGKTQADAYRAAYDAKKMKAATIQRNASTLMDNNKVAARVEELRVPIIEKMGITLESHMNDLERIRDLALHAEQYSAAISAEISRGKAAGLYVERVHINDKQSLPSVFVWGVIKTQVTEKNDAAR